MAEKHLTKKEQGAKLRDTLLAYRDTIESVVPKYMTPERVINITIAATVKTPKLLQCWPGSVVACVIEAASMGLEVNGLLNQAYLVPFHNSKTRRLEAQLMIGYGGKLDLVRNSGEVKDIQVGAVYAEDDFTYKKGFEPVLEHIPCGLGPKDRGPLVYAYCIVRLKDGGIQWHVTDEAEAMAAKAAARTKDVWEKYPEQMWIKTAIHRVTKMLPKSPEARRAAGLEELVQEGIPQRLDVDHKIFPEQEEEEQDPLQEIAEEQGVATTPPKDMSVQELRQAVAQFRQHPAYGEVLDSHDIKDLRSPTKEQLIAALENLEKL